MAGMSHIPNHTDYTGPAKVHFNLSIGGYAITPLAGPDKGRVIATGVEAVDMIDGTAKVCESMWQRCFDGSKRTVHAWFVGTVVATGTHGVDVATHITYRPKERGEFFNVATGAAVTSAARIRFAADGHMYTD